jgi:type IV fimbrial biogenesis protein FimT
MLRRAPSLSRRRQPGMTVLELMITLTVVSVLAVIAIPSYTHFVAAQRVRAAATELYLAIVKARSEALKRSASVTITPASSGWQNGWTIPDPATGNTNIESHAALTGVTISGPTSVVYQSSGRVYSAVQPSCSASPPVACFVITSPTWSGAAGCVSIDLSGRPYSVSGVTTCSN